MGMTDSVHSSQTNRENRAAAPVQPPPCPLPPVAMAMPCPTLLSPPFRGFPGPFKAVRLKGNAGTRSHMLENTC